MIYLRDYAEDATVYHYFTTSDGSGGAVAPSTAFENSDVNIYKNGSATQKTSTNGLTMTSPFDAETGLHLLEIDTSNDTGDSGFWEVGNDYTIILTPDETVDGQTVVFAWQFSIENSSSFALVESFTAGVSSSTTLINNAGGVTETTDNHWVNRIALWRTGALAGQTALITASSGGTPKTFTVDTMTDSPASGDRFNVI